MSEIKTTVGDLKPGDCIRFPNALGRGYVWIDVSRAIPKGPLVELLIATGADVDYKTCAATRQIVRRSRVGES